MGKYLGRMICTAAAVLCLAACQNPQSAASSMLATGSIGPVPVEGLSARPIEASTAMTLGAADASPDGFISFCARRPDQCADTGDVRETAAATPQLWEELERVNRTFNTAIRPMEDAVHYGRIDYWTIPTDGFGDCEDYALAKRQALIAQGLPRRALHIAIGRVPGEGAHAVLSVSTDQGDYVLDNLNANVLPWQKANIAWIAREVPGQTAWAKIGISQVVLAGTK